MNQFDSIDFQNAYHTNQPLGAFCGKEGTLFCLWAPAAEEVSLRLYRAGNGGLPEQVLPMVPKEKGIWEYETPENLDGIYYDYDVTVEGVRRRTADPYARACGLNGHRSMVLDLRRTDPKGWDQDRAPDRDRESADQGKLHRSHS